MPIEKRKIVIVGTSPYEEKIYLEALGEYELHFITNADECNQCLKKAHYHLAIVNYHMGTQESGLELLREMNRLTKNRLPIILLIEEGNEKIAVAAMQEGVRDYLIKSEIVPPIIAMAVRRAMEQKKWERLYHNTAQEEKGLLLKDPLTNLYNRCYFETRLSEETARSQRYHFPLTLLMFHIDQFDEITKKWGANNSNLILKELAQMLVGNLRSSDLLARIKKDQLALLLPHTSLEAAQLVWQRITNQVRECPFAVEKENFYINLRGLLISLNKEIEAIDALIRQAEEALEKNKNNKSGEPLLLYLNEDSF